MTDEQILYLLNDEEVIERVRMFEEYGFDSLFSGAGHLHTPYQRVCPSCVTSPRFRVDRGWFGTETRFYLEKEEKEDEEK